MSHAVPFVSAGTRLIRRRTARVALTVVVSAALSLATASVAVAGTLYAAQGGNNASDLYTIDPLTGAATSVGTIGLAVTGMAEDPTTGILYGVTTPSSPSSAKTLITIDTATGTPTLIGSLDPGSGSEIIAEIEFDSTGSLWGWSESGDHFVAIDKATGALTDFPGVISSSGDGMAYVPGSDTLVIMPEGSGGDYYSIDRSTGAVTTLGTLTGAPISNSVAAATQSCDGLTTWATIIGSPGHVVTVDFATGVMTDVGSTVVNTIDALAWVCGVASPPAAPVTPATPATPVAAPVTTVTPPVLGRPSIAPLSRCTPSKGNCRVPISFSLDEAAAVTIKITRKYGRRVADKCVRVTPRNRHKQRCRIIRPTYTKQMSGKAGANTYTFKLPSNGTRGFYNFTITAVNGEGASKTQRGHFVIPWK